MEEFCSVDRVFSLLAAYKTGAINLAQLAVNIEPMLEDLPPTKNTNQIKNLYYLIEDINAIVLDERREMAQDEKHAVTKYLQSLEELLSGPPNAGSGI